MVSARGGEGPVTGCAVAEAWTTRASGEIPLGEGFPRSLVGVGAKVMFFMLLK